MNQLSNRYFHKFLKQSSISFIGTLCKRLGYLLLSIYFARTLTKSDFGQLQIIRSTIDTVLIVAGLGLPTALNYFIGKYKQQKHIVINVILFSFGITLLMTLINLVLLLLLYIGVFTIDKITLGSVHLLVLLFLLSTILLWTTIGQAILNSFLDFLEVSISIFFSFLLGLLFFYLKLPNDIVSAMEIYIFIEFILLLFVSSFVLRRLFQYNYSFVSLRIKKKIVYSLVGYMFPTYLSGVLALPMMWLVKVLLIAKGSQFSELATFEAYYQLMAMSIFIPTSISQVVLPILMSADKNMVRKNFFFDSSKLTLILSLIILLFFILFRGLLISMYGENYQSSISLILILIAGFISVANNLIGKLLASQKKMWTGFLVNLFWALMLISMAFILRLWNFSTVFTLSLAFLLSHAALFLAQFSYVYKTRLYNN